jgi:voltage-gated sodium channel
MTPTDRSTVPLRARLLEVAEGPRVQRVVIALIVINAITLGLETSPAVMAAIGPALLTIDAAILAVFVLEIGARLTGRGLGFFRDPWSVFDFVIVAIALLPASGPFAVLRALRILRVLRLFSMVPSMRKVVGGLLAAMPGIASIALIMLILFYVAAVVATNLFGDGFADWFGSIGRSMYTLFQIMTLESWSMGIVRPVMEAYPYAWAFFIPFILVATFTMLNLFIGVIVSAIQGQEAALHAHTEATVEQAAEGVRSATHADVESLRTEIRQLRGLLEARRDGGS